VIWRSVIVAFYVALAIVVGVAYGLHGLAILSVFYVWAGAWLVFSLVWGDVARAAGRWNYRRTEPARPEPEPRGPDPGSLEPLREAEEAVRVEPLLDAL
jgi:hypothetical protein